MKVLIIGGVAGGASAAARLRRLDENAQIILLERGPDISFANCGLPYYIGGVIKKEQKLRVLTPEEFRRSHKVDVRVHSEALSIDPAAKTVRVRDQEGGREYTEDYDSLILATGAAPVKPPLPGVEDERIFTLRDIPDTLAIHNYVKQRAPKSAVVVGGGFIGLEMAENLARQGLKVTVVEMAPHVLPPFDADMAAGLQQYLREQGLRLRLGEAVRGFEAVDGFGSLEGDVLVGGSLLVKLDNADEAADMVILAVGVRPESKLAADAGLAVGAKGGIVVDDYLRTSNEHIYAVGDVVQVTNSVSGRKAQVPLAGPANRQGRIAADNVAGLDVRYKGAQGSAVVQLFDMTAAVTGLNEAAARAAGLEIEKVYIDAPSHATYYPGARNMVLKLLFEKQTGRVLGAQAVGFEGVDKRCDVLAVAIRAGMTAPQLSELDLAYAPPYSSAKDPVNLLGYIAENVLTGRVKQYYWEDLDKVPTDGSVTLLDVRTPEEFARGHLEHAVNIPLGELRSRLAELDREKPLYINCQSGRRSYTACRILTQKGFDCRHFAGGFGLYSALQQQYE